MRVIKYDEATEARGNSLTRAFRELLRARMLWATGGVAIMGLMVGFIFYNSDSRLPFQNQPTATDEVTIQSPSSFSTGQSVATAEEKAPVDVPELVSTASSQASEVLAAVACDENAHQKATAIRDNELAAEIQRYQQLMSKRSGLRQLISAITGSASVPPSQEEISKHEATVDGINQRYQQALATTNC